MAYRMDDNAIVALTYCPNCGVGLGTRCKRNNGRPVTPHPQRVQEAKRLVKISEPYPKKEQVEDGLVLMNNAVAVPPERHLHSRELADFARSCRTNIRHTAVKVSKQDLAAMVAEISRHRAKKIITKTV